MALKLGVNSINKLYIGSTAIYKAYLGAGILFSGEFSPASIFAGGTEGAWYDPSDLSTLFQDSAGTTPVTASGQPVGKMLDKSGNGNHATQATSSRRPTYTEGGGLSWLAFDGVDDAMVTAAVDFTDTDNVSVFVGVRKPTDGSTGPIIINADKGSDNGSFTLYAPHNTTSRKWAWSLGGSSQNFYAVDTLAAPNTAVMTGLFDGAGSDLAARINPRLNGVTQTSFSISVGGGTAANFQNAALRIGSQSATVDYFNGNLYGLIIPGKLASADEIAATEAYMAAKSGVTL